MTLTIVLIGGVILLVFIVVPLQEFRLILTRLREKPPMADAPPAERGFDVAAGPDHRAADDNKRAGERRP